MNKIFVANFYVGSKGSFFANVLLMCVLLFGLYNHSAAQTSITIVSPKANKIIDAQTAVETVAKDLKFTEGPVWFNNMLLFSDLPANCIYKLDSTGNVSVYMSESGLQGVRDTALAGFCGTNGLSVGTDGNLVACQHGSRRVVSIAADLSQRVICDNYKGKKFNSPNDLAIANNGTVFFSDPPYGLAGQDASTLKQAKYNGVYSVSPNGTVVLCDTSFERPNGMALSPDQKYLYIANSGGTNKYWKRFKVNKDGSLSDGKIFFDASKFTQQGYCDGMKTDHKGNIFATGPGGVLIISPKGEHLATINLPQMATNCAWGGADGKWLYITAREVVYRVKVKTGK